MDENSEITFQRFSCHVLKWLRVSSVELCTHEDCTHEHCAIIKLLRGENSFCVVNVSVVRWLLASVAWVCVPTIKYCMCCRIAVSGLEFHIIVYHAQRLMFKNHLQKKIGNQERYRQRTGSHLLRHSYTVPPYFKLIWTADSWKLSISRAYCIVKQFFFRSI